VPRRVNPELLKLQKTVAEKAGVIAAGHLISGGYFELSAGKT